MTKRNILGWCKAARVAAVALLAGLFVAACGGGGGGDDGDTASTSLEGAWRVSLTNAVAVYAGDTVPAASVPTPLQVPSISTATMAQLYGSTFWKGDTVTVDGASLTITGPSTNLFVTIDGVSASNYQTCWPSCGVGTIISYDALVTVTTIDRSGAWISGTPHTESTTVRYTRVN